MADRDGAGSRSIRALDVLEAVAGMERAASAGDIAAAANLPKATVHRLCNLLLEEGFLRRDVSGRGYELGDRTLKFAMTAVSGHGGRSERHAILEAVARDIGETCNITVPTPEGMFYLDRVESEWPLRIQLPPGSSVPFHCTASGKLYLASLPSEQRRRLIEKLTLDEHGPNTITDVEALCTEIDKVSRSKIGFENEEFIPGMICVAVPISDANGRMLATLATHGPVARMSVENALAHVERLRDAAADLAESFK